MNTQVRAEVDEALERWIIGVLENFLKRGFTPRQIHLALEAAMEKFAVTHMYKNPDVALSDPAPLPAVMPEDAPEPEKKPKPQSVPVYPYMPQHKRSRQKKQAKKKEPIKITTKKVPQKKAKKKDPRKVPDKGYCEKCHEKMEIIHRVTNWPIEFIRWKCNCGWEHLQKQNLKEAGCER